MLYVARWDAGFLAEGLQFGTLALTLIQPLQPFEDEYECDGCGAVPWPRRGLLLACAKPKRLSGSCPGHSARFDLLRLPGSYQKQNDRMCTSLTKHFQVANATTACVWPALRRAPRGQEQPKRLTSASCVRQRKLRWKWRQRGRRQPRRMLGFRLCETDLRIM